MVVENIKLGGYIMKKMVAPLSCVVTILYPALFLYLRNIDEVTFGEMARVGIMELGICSIMFLLFSLTRRSITEGSIFTTTLILFFLNYSFAENLIQKIFIHAEFWHIVPLATLICVIVSCLLCRYAHAILGEINKVVLILFSTLIGINLIMAIPAIVNKVSTKRIEERNTYAVSTQIKETPNIYWMIFDEYSSREVIGKYYDYDNSLFFSNLENMGFNISYSGTNDSHKSSTVITNYMNMDYVVNDSMSETEKEHYRKNPDLFMRLKKAGYELKGTGEAYTLGIDEGIMEFLNIGDSVKATIGGDTYKELVLKKTIVAPFISGKRDAFRGKIFDGIDATVKLSQSADHTFCFCYFQIPHEPFVFDQNGNEVDASHYYDWKNPQYYLNQYIYTSKLIEDFTKRLIMNDPNCIIILQSDHSARAASDYDLYRKWISVEDMRTFLNAIYYKGESFDIEGLSGVNTMRTIFSNLFDEDMPMLEVVSNE